ncbi:hypothetical protein KBD59_01465 [Candidatus Gracilibacteria bacterium]|nr:hypothetical protein [Candidatus Gracilibacteria bacterium]
MTQEAQQPDGKVELDLSVMTREEKFRFIFGGATKAKIEHFSDQMLDQQVRRKIAQMDKVAQEEDAILGPIWARIRQDAKKVSNRWAALQQEIDKQ